MIKIFALNKKVAIILGAVALAPLYALCQDFDKNSKDFYPRDFVNQPAANAPAQETARPGLTTKKQTPSALFKKEKKNKKQAGRPESETSKALTKKSQDNNLESSALEVQTLGAILDGTDAQHLAGMLDELVDTSVRYDFALGEIYIIGFGADLENLNAYMLKIVAREGRVMPRARPPERYPVAKSPTWIVATNEGEILLEGTGPLKENFDEKGRFVDRHKILEK